MSEVFSTSLTTDSTAVTVKVLLLESIGIKQEARRTIIIGEANFAILTVLRCLLTAELIKKQVLTGCACSHSMHLMNEAGENLCSLSYFFDLTDSLS